MDENEHVDARMQTGSAVDSLTAPSAEQRVLTFTPCAASLPAARDGRLISDPLLFSVEGRVYSGHYHTNGWFYENSHADSTIMAMGSKNPVQSQSKWSRATHWCYLSAIAKAEGC